MPVAERAYAVVASGVLSAPMIVLASTDKGVANRILETCRQEAGARLRFMVQEFVLVQSLDDDADIESVMTAARAVVLTGEL